MAGRDDFGILRSSILVDRRAHRAADLYVEAQLAVPSTALAAVCGHIALLGLWAMTQTDDGVLPDDGTIALQHATLCARTEAQRIVVCLRDAELLRPTESGLYLVGFRDCYGDILERRAENREQKRLARAEAAQAREERRRRLQERATSPAPKTPPKGRKEAAPRVAAGTSDTRPQDVRGTSNGRPQDVSGMSGLTVPCRTVPAVPSEPDGTERPERSSGHPDPVGARVAALASEADAAPRASVGALSGMELDADGLPKLPPPARKGTPEYDHALAVMRERKRILDERKAQAAPASQPYKPPSPEEFERRRAEALAKLGESPPDPPLDDADRKVAAILAEALEAGKLRIESPEQVAELEAAQNLNRIGASSYLLAEAVAQEKALLAAERERRGQVVQLLRSGHPQARPWIARLEALEPVWRACAAARKATRRKPRDA